MKKILTIRGYDIWVDDEGFYGIVKEGEKCYLCCYRFLSSALRPKGL